MNTFNRTISDVPLRRVDIALGIGILLFIIISFIGPLLCGPEKIIPYNPNQSVENATYLAPLEKDPQGGQHTLGTDRYGRDVLTRVIYGSKTAILVGLATVLISFLVAIIFGVLSGYYGDNSVRFNLVQLLVAIITLVLLSFYFRYGDYLLSLIVLIIGLLIIRVSFKIPVRQFFLPVDTIVIKLIEVVKTIPALFVILSLFAIFSKASLWNLIIILGLISWPGKARLLRAEILKAKSLNYITSARIAGLSDWAIIKSHLLPNVLSPLIIACCYTFTGAILAESTLSFLNVGLPQDIPSWGGIMRESRDYFSAWWLAIFPGVLLFAMILMLNMIADRLNQIQ